MNPEGVRVPSLPLVNKMENLIESFELANNGIVCFISDEIQWVSQDITS